MDSFHDEGGLFAVAGHSQAAHLVWLGLQALTHRGARGAGLVASDTSLLRVRRQPGPPSELFGAVDPPAGRLAIGQLAGGAALVEERPLLGRYRGGQVAVALGGRLTDGPWRRNELKRAGHLFLTTSDAETLLRLIGASPQRTAVNRLVDALHQVTGAFAMLALTEDRLVAVRDPRGFRPLWMGEVEGATVFASEDGAIRFLGGRAVRELAPGEMVVVDGDGVKQVNPFRPTPVARCAQEVVQVARGDGTVLGVAVGAARHALGHRLAKERPCASADAVVGLPGATMTVAQGYAEASELPLISGLLRVGDDDARAPLPPPGGMPGLALRARWAAVHQLIRARRVVLVLPALLTGERARDAISLLREAGAAEVHLRVASPLVRGACPYGLGGPPEDWLVARKAGGEDAWVEALGLDSVGFLSRDGLLGVMGEGGACTACVGGDLPVPTSEPDDQLPLFGGAAS